MICPCQDIPENNKIAQCLAALDAHRLRPLVSELGRFAQTLRDKYNSPIARTGYPEMSPASSIFSFEKNSLTVKFRFLFPRAPRMHIAHLSILDA